MACEITRSLSRQSHLAAKYTCDVSRPDMQVARLRRLATFDPRDDHVAERQLPVCIGMDHLGGRGSSPGGHPTRHTASPAGEGLGPWSAQGGQGADPCADRWVAGGRAGRRSVDQTFKRSTAAMGAQPRAHWAAFHESAWRKCTRRRAMTFRCSAHRSSACGMRRASRRSRAKVAALTSGARGPTAKARSSTLALGE